MLDFMPSVCWRMVAPGCGCVSLCYTCDQACEPSRTKLFCHLSRLQSQFNILILSFVRLLISSIFYSLCFDSPNFQVPLLMTAPSILVLKTTPSPFSSTPSLHVSFPPNTEGFAVTLGWWDCGYKIHVVDLKYKLRPFALLCCLVYYLYLDYVGVTIIY